MCDWCSHKVPNILWLNLWKIKKAKTVLHGFIEIGNESKSKPNNMGWSRKRILQEPYAKMVRR